MESRPSLDVLLDDLAVCSSAGGGEAQFEDLLASYEPHELAEAIEPRLHQLANPGGEFLLRLVEALDEARLYKALAEVLLVEPDLPTERLLQALDLLHESGLIEAYPDLAERWEEWCEASNADSSLEELAEQIESDREGLWLALQGLQPVEPEVRADILRGLATGQRPYGPGLVEFFRFLTHCHEPTTRAAALEALESTDQDDEFVIAAWATIAADHAEPEISSRALRWLGDRAEAAIARWAGPERHAPRIGRTLISAVDGEGLGTIVLVAHVDGKSTIAAFGCDAERGVREAIGQERAEESDIEAIFAEFSGRAAGEVALDEHRLAIGLLKVTLSLSGPATSPALRFWLEHTVGPQFVETALPTWLDENEPERHPRANLAQAAEAILAACPSWLDRSEWTTELAHELALREPGQAPDPVRDAALYRYYYEHRLVHRLEVYRRMLFWMAALWQAQGRSELTRAALLFSRDLAEPSVALPSHPFLEALISRSLANLIRQQESC